MDEEHSQVGVSALADPSEPAELAAGAFARRDAEVRSEVAARGEAVDLGDEGDESGGGEDADAGHREQMTDRGDRRCEGCELLHDGVTALVELADLEGGLGEGGA